MGAGTDLVVLVDDERSVLQSASALLKGAGMRRLAAIEDARTLIAALEHEPAAVVVLDLIMPHTPGTELLPRILRHWPETQVIVMTASLDVDTAVDCMKEGAFDYLVKPVDETRFVTSVRRALEMHALRREVGELKRHLLEDQLSCPEAFASIVTGNRRMRALFHYLESVSRSLEPLLITGETGVGKELFAEAAHRLSGRSGNFLQVNVAGLDDNLFSDALFGHRKGAFTGALERREGLVAQAAGGTLFLDEIGDLKPASQVKLLRLVQDQMYHPLGSDLARNSDVRVVCATNRDLAGLMSKGQFREDLYYRLSVHQLQIPPLRDRTEDLQPLVAHFLQEAATSMERATPRIPGELYALLANYPFPGNVRELRAMVYDAVALHRGGAVLSMERFRGLIDQRLADLPPRSPKISGRIAVPKRFPTLKEAEEQLMREALQRANGNQGIAATLLGISRTALNRRLGKFRASNAD